MLNLVLLVGFSMKIQGEFNKLSKIRLVYCLNSVTNMCFKNNVNQFVTYADQDATSEDFFVF